MVSIEDVLPGLVIGVAVAVGAAVLTGQARPGELRENVGQFAQVLPDQMRQTGGMDAQLTGVDRPFSDATTFSGIGQAEDPVSGKLIDIPLFETQTGVEVTSQRAAGAIAERELAVSGFDGNFI